MKEKVKYDFVEAEIQVNCVACDYIVVVIVDIDNPFFDCPRCGSVFEFTYKVIRITPDRFNRTKNGLQIKPFHEL